MNIFWLSNDDVYIISYIGNHSDQWTLKWSFLPMLIFWEILNAAWHITSILLKEPRVFAQFDQFLPVRSHFDTKRPVHFFHIATFPSPTFGPLFAFRCPLFFVKNNNLECRDVLKTVTVTSDQKRFGPYTAYN